MASIIGRAKVVVTNPPYGKDALPIAESVVELVHGGAVEMAALLLPALWEAAGSPRRVALMRAMSLRITCCFRPIWIEGTNGGGKLNYAWYIWTREIPALPRLVSISPEDIRSWATP